MPPFLPKHPQVFTGGWRNRGSSCGIPELVQQPGDGWEWRRPEEESGGDLALGSCRSCPCCAEFSLQCPQIPEGGCRSCPSILLAICAQISLQSAPKSLMEAAGPCPRAASPPSLCLPGETRPRGTRNLLFFGQG